MTRRLIAKLGQPVLLEVAKSIDDVREPDVQNLIDDMIETLFEAQGVGLAAPQVYESKRVIIALDVEAADEDEEPPMHILINPEIEALGDEISYDIEGCLSIDNLSGIVPRRQKIRVRALNRDGTALNFVAEDYFARVIQHEVDHLDGILYPMRVRDWSALCNSNERRQLHRMLEEGYERP